MSPFQKIVRSELISARTQHGNQNSAHEAYAVILEEVEEFWAQCKLKREARSKTMMLSELVQIAAMAQRAAEDLGLIDQETFLD